MEGIVSPNCQSYSMLQNLRNRIHFRECLMNKFAADIDEVPLSFFSHSLAYSLFSSLI